MSTHVEMRWHRQDEVLLPIALWCPGPGYRMISSGVLGGGIGLREWVLNAQVLAGHSRTDPAAHVAELAVGLGLEGNGVGLLTAARVSDLVQCEDEGAYAAATVGLRVPTWAAVPSGNADRELAPARRPGTINSLGAARLGKYGSSSGPVVPIALRPAAYARVTMLATTAQVSGSQPTSRSRMRVS